MLLNFEAAWHIIPIADNNNEEEDNNGEDVEDEEEELMLRRAIALSLEGAEEDYEDLDLDWQSDSIRRSRGQRLSKKAPETVLHFQIINMATGKTSQAITPFHFLTFLIF